MGLLSNGRTVNGYERRWRGRREHRLEAHAPRSPEGQYACYISSFFPLTMQTAMCYQAQARPGPAESAPGGPRGMRRLQEERTTGIDTQAAPGEESPTTEHGQALRPDDEQCQASRQKLEKKERRLHFSSRQPHLQLPSRHGTKRGACPCRPQRARSVRGTNTSATSTA